MKSNIKKVLAGAVVVGTFVAYVWSQKMPDDEVVATSIPSESTAPTVVTSDTTPVPTAPTPRPVTPRPTPKPAGAFRDGTYTGVVADAYYGNVEVQAVIQNGVLADVVFLQHPNDRGTSIRINNAAMPLLKSEAIRAQSANVNTISGASETSRAFRESLQSALSQAKA